MTDPTMHKATLMDLDRTFTRSDGSIVARIYERLTKRSRRRATNTICEMHYRRGVYEAYKSLQNELTELYE